MKNAMLNTAKVPSWLSKFTREHREAALLSTERSASGTRTLGHRYRAVEKVARLRRKRLG
jgi:hypothetical protein